MTFDWSEYLFLAEELAEKPSRPCGVEPRLRSAVSRAYYAAFCTARNHLRDKDGWPVPRGSDAHAQVINEFKNSLDRGHAKVGINLDRLRWSRNRADYDDAVGSLANLATTSLGQARQTICALRTLS